MKIILVRMKCCYKKLSHLHCILEDRKPWLYKHLKILYELSPVLKDLVVKKKTNYNFRYSNILQIPSVKTTLYGKRSFRYAAPVLWNSLPEHFRKTKFPSGMVKFVNVQLVVLISSWQRSFISKSYICCCILLLASCNNLYLFMLHACSCLML